MTLPMLSLGAAATLAFAGPVSAQGYTDPASGLSVSPPAGYQAAPSTKPNARFDVTLDVTSQSGIPAVQSDGRLCAVAYKAAPANAALSKAEISRELAKPEWRNLYKATFGLIGTVNSERTFRHQGYTGLEFMVTPKAGPNAAAIRMHVATIETRKGRTVLSCVTDAAGLRKALPVFAAIRRGTLAPE